MKNSFFFWRSTTSGRKSHPKPKDIATCASCAGGGWHRIATEGHSAARIIFTGQAFWNPPSDYSYLRLKKNPSPKFLKLSPSQHKNALLPILRYVTGCS